MGLHEQEQDGLFDYPLGDYPLPRELRVIQLSLPRTYIRCAACTAWETIPKFGIYHVEQQMKLYRGGWRRDPATGLDYCPLHRSGE